MEKTIYSYLIKQIDANRSSLAVFDENRSVTYGELEMLANTILSAFPIESPRYVGIVMEHSVEMIASMIAVLMSGAAFVPVEPAFPPERINFMMNDAGVDFVITNKKYESLTSGHSQLFIESGWKINECRKASKALADSPAYVLYTSGTTGKPKGVVVENRNVCHYSRAFEAEFHIGPGDVMLQYSVCSFDIFIEEVFTTLLNGATLGIPTEETKGDINALMKFVDRHHITIISGFPYLLLEMNKLNSIPSSLRLLISGGDVLRGSYVTNLIGHVDVYNTYGPSETTVCATYFRCNDARPLADDTYPIGKAVKGARVEVLDASIQPVPVGEIGEICILGDGVSRGYLCRTPESENFTTTPEGERMYRSGDLGYLMPDGNIAFLHRKDKQVMILGKRVECDEVENILCACPEVEQGAVCPQIDSQGLSYLVAYFVPNAEHFSLRELKRKMSMYLTPFMIPEFFVEMKSLPHTLNGKIDRRALPVVLKEGNL